MTTGSERKIAFILAGGPRIGLSVATAFQNAGYVVIVGNRNPTTNAATPQLSALGIKLVTVDVTSASSIMIAFDKIKHEPSLGILGTPTVVVYNAAALTMAAIESKQQGSPGEGIGIFGMDVWTFESDLNTNLVGAYVCLHEAVRGWKNSDSPGPEADGLKKVPKVFIATGNVVPWQPVPEAMTLGSGKAALAHLVQCGSMSKEYQEKGWGFYFVSQVTEEGGPVPYDKVDGTRHGGEYVRIVEGSEESWDVRFTA